jgi:UDP-glucose 6-dehydrogenase
MRITMIGTGYVGLVSGACFSDFGQIVTCVDKDAAKIGRLKNGSIPIFEPGLKPLVERNIAAGRQFFETEPGPAIRSADAVFVAVGTPSRRGSDRSSCMPGRASAAPAFPRTPRRWSPSASATIRRCGSSTP